MARQAYLFTIPPPPGPPSAPRGLTSPPPAGGALTEPRRSQPTSLPPIEGVPLAAALQLIDRLGAMDEWGFLVQWLESSISTRARVDPAIAVRLLRGYREIGRFDKAKEVISALPSAPNSWNALDAARLFIERAMVATFEGRTDHAEADLRLASRHLSSATRGTGQREQLDIHVATCQLELRLDRSQPALSALRLAEHVAERLEDGPWRVPLSMTLGHLAMRLSEPRTAVKHYDGALAAAPSRRMGAMNARASLAIALASIGRVDEARLHAQDAIALAGELNAGWRHADMYDVMAIVEIAADRPAAALQAIDEAIAVLGDVDQPALRCQLADHRTWALAALGRAQSAEQALARSEKLRADGPALSDPLDELELVATRARALEACGRFKEAIEAGLPYATRMPSAYVTGSLNLVIGRCAQAIGDEALARTSVERVALAGDRHGWVFPDRTASGNLWGLAQKLGDSRIVRYAERVLEGPSVVPPASSPSFLLPVVPSTRSVPRLSSLPPPPETDANIEALDRPSMEGEVLLYVTTPQGVSRVPASELKKATEDSTLIVDTLTHALRIEEKEISLERRRALEPLVVQLLRRAREGLSAEEILRAAGGPGPESADAEHRVRVLISRVRDLLGDPTTIERLRDAGEYGKTRYRLAPHVKFALIEPLSTGGI